MPGSWLVPANSRNRLLCYDGSMPKPTLSDLAELVRSIIIPFYQLQRQTPLPPFATGRYEDDAQHSWSVALLAAALAPQVDETLDIGKICQFAIVHDLVEVVAGDVSNFASDTEKASKDENEAVAKKILDDRLKALPWITTTIDEYETQNTPEARFVKSVDKIIPLLFDYIENGEFYKSNKITLEHWQAQMQKHRQKANAHAGAFAYYDELWNLLLVHPEFFYQPGENHMPARKS